MSFERKMVYHVSRRRACDKKFEKSYTFFKEARITRVGCEKGVFFTKLVSADLLKDIL